MTLVGLTPFVDPEPAQQPALPPPPSVSETQTEEDRRYRLHRQFDRLGRLYGDRAVEALMQTRVIVFGLGGVGSFAAEALARSAIGHLMLVDFDEVCVTNTNRQLQALRGTVGQSKAKLLAERCSQINAAARIEYRHAFYNAQTAEELLQSPWASTEGNTQYDWVIDCIDHVPGKAHLLAECRRRNIPIVSSMGAAGKLDPTLIQKADLADTHGDPLAKKMRQMLRKEYGFPAQGAFSIHTVFSPEERQWPKELDYDRGQGFKCVCPHKNPAHNCDARNLIDGNAVFVTGTFGLAVASVVINSICQPLMAEAQPGLSQRGNRPKNA